MADVDWVMDWVMAGVDRVAEEMDWVAGAPTSDHRQFRISGLPIFRSAMRFLVLGSRAGGGGGWVDGMLECQTRMERSWEC